MATYVLVHGAYHGGWCWRKVVPLLRGAGHEVHTPTLTGLGERVHLAHAGIDLDTHLSDVANVLAYEDLRGVVLVGHSYGGLVISGAAARVPERLAHLVFLDAIIPRDGQSWATYSGRGAAFVERARAEGDGWRLPPGTAAHPFGVTDEDDARWVRERLVPQPLATTMQPVRLTSPAAAALPRTVILCTGAGDEAARTARREDYRARVQPPPEWRWRELPTGHDAMITAPRALADLLLEVA